MTDPTTPKTLIQRRAGTVCSRCRGQRWPFKAWMTPYICQRCRAALRGGFALDPLGATRSPAQQAAAQALGHRRRVQDGRFLLEQGGVGGDLAPLDREEPQSHPGGAR